MSDWKETNGHSLEVNRHPNPYGSTSTIRCTNEGCHVEVSSEFGTRKAALELAEEYTCPSGVARCVVCSFPIKPNKDICQQCYSQIDVSARIYE